MKEFKSGKNLKRNLILAAVLFFVCGAAYLNWSFNNKWGRADSAMARAEDAMTAALEEDYGSALAAGIPMLPAYRGTGYDKQQRTQLDFGSSVYVIEI